MSNGRKIGLTIHYHHLVQETIQLLAGKPGISGYEYRLFPALEQILRPIVDEIYTDLMDNCYAVKKGYASNQTIMLAAHSDEIGLMITHIDAKGFLHFSPIGGIDERTLLYQEVTVHGRKDLQGIICFVPETSNDNNRKSIKLEKMAIDIGYTTEEAQQLINPGDIVSINRTTIDMLNQTIAGKSLDNRAGIAVLTVCLSELNSLKHKHNVVAVTTVQEEVGTRGAQTSTEMLNPAIAVAVDVTHGQTIDAKNQVSIHLGKGPAITIGPNIHPTMHSLLTTCAQNNNFPYQIQPIAGPTGTDARIIQLSSSGIPTGLLSIPLRYMHTSVETASLKDVVNCGKLLARFIAALPEDLEEISCS